MPMNTSGLRRPPSDDSESIEFQTATLAQIFSLGMLPHLEDALRCRLAGSGYTGFDWVVGFAV